MELVLQDIQFPSVEVCDRQNMYIRAGAPCVVSMSEKTLWIPEGESASFSTYFNSFSLRKWKKYTTIDNISLELDFSGTLVVQICVAEQINGDTHIHVTGEQVVSSDERALARIPIDIGQSGEIVYFRLVASSGRASFFGGAFVSEVDEGQLRDVRLGIAICTFNREDAVVKNITELRESIIDNPESPLHGKVDVFISDNGQTLPDELNSGPVRVFKNRNVGGAGGFGRAMIEFMKVKDELGLTHILMMDDDVLFGCDSLRLLSVFLRLLKPEHREAFVGGHMLKLNSKHIQSEGADYFGNLGHVAIKFNYNLEKLEWIVRNEIEDPVNCFGWWYCCMPASVVREDNLPMPVFIKRDDFEYSLRNGTKFVTLNGICVWHEEFNFKNSSYLDYYYLRNHLMLIARHRSNVSKEELWNYADVRVQEKINTYRYKEAELILLGIQDFLRGVDWLKDQDAEALNSEIMKLGYKKQPIEEIDWPPFVYGTFTKTRTQKDTKQKKRIRKITKGGMLRSAKKNIVVDMYRPKEHLFYRANKVLNFEDYTKTGFVTQRSRESYRAINQLRKEMKRQFMANYDRVAREYHDRFGELTSLAYWNKYLFEESEAAPYNSVLPTVLRPASTKAQKKELRDIRKRQAQQAATFWLPVKKNRVMVEVHKRRGFTCSPKYIVLRLLEEYGDRLEIIWVTDYPEDSKEVKELGIPVVKQGSKEHFDLYRQARVYVTNDSFPAWASRESRQVWINTWHGAINYKHIGYDHVVTVSEVRNKIYHMQNRQPDYFLAATRAFLTDTAESFQLSEAAFVETGLPRNDVFFGEHPEVREKVFDTYGIPSDSKVVLYAPTFRIGTKLNTFGLEFDRLRDALASRFGGKWVVLFRSHYFVTGGNGALPEGVIDATRYHDMNELLYTADVLLSDYSSCMYDFSLQEKPCFVFGVDMESYAENERDFAIPPTDWPYPITTSNEELANAIEAFDDDAYRQKLQEHFASVGRFDDGNATDRVVKLIANACGL